jgi:TPR repeat protein
MTLRCSPIPVLLFAAAFPVTAEPPAPKLEDLFNGSDPAAFLKAARPLAEQGDVEALFLMGKAYHQGKGVEKDLVQAAEYYRKAAAKDHARALNNLGLLELDHQRSLQSARTHLERALALGLKLPTLYNLGRAYDQGDWVSSSEDLATAGQYFRQAYEAGYGEVALDEAITALVKAAWKERSFLPKDTPSKRFLELRKEAVGLGAKAALLKRPRGLQNIGALYFEMRDYAAALPWIRQAADLNQPMALYTLGKAYREGLGVTKDPKLSLAFFERAAVLDQSDAKYEVSRHWEAAVAAMHDPAELDRSVEYLHALQKKATEGGGFLDEAIQRAQARAAISREVERNARRAKPLPPGPVVLNLQILDMPADQGGVPLCNESWYVFAASPEQPPDGYPGKEDLLAEGTADMKGMTHLDEAGAARLRTELEKGHTLIFCWGGQRRILEMDPGPKGEIQLCTGPAVRY